MSRFEQKYHKKLLESSKPERWWRNVRILHKEKRLWNHKEFIDFFSSSLFQNLIGSSFVFGLLFMVLFLLLEQDLYIWLGLILFFGPLLFILTLMIGYNIWAKKRAKNIVRNREDEELEEFILNSPSIQKYNSYHVKAIRQTLGHIYSVSPKKIYLSDTPGSLRALGGTIEPYGFELILGAVKRLGIFLTEAEVDRIAERVHNNAHDVEELTAILCEEMSVAEEAQSNVDFEAQLMNVGEKLLEKKGKYKLRLGLPEFVALICFLGATNAVLEEGDNLFTLPAVIFVLKAAAIGYLIGLTIRFVGMSFLKYFDSKKSEASKKLGEIDLEELKDLADNSPPKRYVNSLIMELYRKQDYEKILKKYEPLPLVDDFESDEMSWFTEVANRLKKMAKIEQVPCIKPRNETIPLVIYGKPVNLNVEFCDGLKDGYVKLSLER